MFTGIVETIGKIRRVQPGKVWKLEVDVRKKIPNLKKGDSIAVNGVCLTVTGIKSSNICFEVIPETIENTNISKLKKGDLVNLERSLKFNGELSGHLVTGHIDGTGEIVNIRRVSKSQVEMEIETNSEFMKFIAPKGSICVDGVSLTVTSTEKNIFRISLAPFTLNNTTLGEKRAGEEINIEVDLIARYLFNFFSHQTEGRIDKETLKKYGFI